jgi:hypothetical protein
VAFNVHNINYARNSTFFVYVFCSVVSFLLNSLFTFFLIALLCCCLQCEEFKRINVDGNQLKIHDHRQAVDALRLVQKTLKHSRRRGMSTIFACFAVEIWLLWNLSNSSCLGKIAPLSPSLFYRFPLLIEKFLVHINWPIWGYLIF